MLLFAYRTLKIYWFCSCYVWLTVAEFAEGTLVFPKLNQLTNHIPPVLNPCFFMPDFALQVNVTENNRILRNDANRWKRKLIWLLLILLNIYLSDFVICYDWFTLIIFMTKSYETLWTFAGNNGLLNTFTSSVTFGTKLFQSLPSSECQEKTGCCYNSSFN